MANINNLSAQDGNGLTAFFCFFHALAALHGVEDAANPHKGQAVFRKDGHRRYSPGNDNIKFLAQLRVPPRFFGSRMVTANLAKAHVLCHLLKEGKALCQGIDEGETHSRIVDLQRQSWKSRSRSHIGNRPIMEALFVIDSQGINHMLYRHFFRVCNGCQVKEAICLQEFILIDFKTPERFMAPSW